MRINGVHGDYFSDGMIKVIFKVIYRLKLAKRYNNNNFMKKTILTWLIYHFSRNLGNQIRTSLVDYKRNIFSEK